MFDVAYVSVCSGVMFFCLFKRRGLKTQKLVKKQLIEMLKTVSTCVDE